MASACSLAPLRAGPGSYGRVVRRGPSFCESGYGDDTSGQDSCSHGPRNKTWYLEGLDLNHVA